MTKSENESGGASPADPNADEEVQKQILRALEGLGYGSVEIIVHDSKIVQIERKEKIRLRKENSTKGK
jgi:hypothetical protein